MRTAEELITTEMAHELDNDVMWVSLPKDEMITLLKFYAQQCCEDLSERIVREATTHNIGCFGRDPYVVVDTDSIRYVEIVTP